MKKGWSTNKIIGVILGCFAAFVILMISVAISVYQITDFLLTLGESSYYEDEYDWDDEYSWEDEYDPYEEESYDSEYYEFHDAIRGDLSYTVVFESYDRDDFMEDSGDVIMECTYPYVIGEIENIDEINDAIYQEIDGIEEYLTDIAGYLGGGEFLFSTEAYVTYMSEEILSIAYMEYAYLDGDYFESYVIPVNIDIKTGMVMQNSQLLSVDDEFSIEFRERCEKQNGEIDSISQMSDQEITEYLTDEASVIAFYTPMGMEIGFNYYDGWVTVTYTDYEKYQQHF